MALGCCVAAAASRAISAFAWSAIGGVSAFPRRAFHEVGVMDEAALISAIAGAVSEVAAVGAAHVAVCGGLGPVRELACQTSSAAVFGCSSSDEVETQCGRRSATRGESFARGRVLTEGISGDGGLFPLGYWSQ